MYYKYYLHIIYCYIVGSFQVLFYVILLFSISLSVFNELNKKLNKELNKLVFFALM